MSGEPTQVSAEATARAVRRGCPVLVRIQGVCRDDVGGEATIDMTEWRTVPGIYIGPHRSKPSKCRVFAEGLSRTARTRDVAIDPTDRVGRACLAWAILQTSGGDMHEHLEAAGETPAGWSVILRRATMGLEMNVAAVRALIVLANVVCGGDHDAA